MKQSTFVFCIAASALSAANAFAFAPTTQKRCSRSPQPQLHSRSRSVTDRDDDDDEDKRSNGTQLTDRRRMLLSSAVVTTTTAIVAASNALPAAADEVNLQQYEDFTKAPEGWSYRDVKVGSGASPSTGDRAVYEWSGYTIGYFGRPFEAKGGPQGGAFDKNQDYSRTVIGKGDVVKGVELALQSMSVGGIRQVIVPYGDLGYPSTKDDAAHDKVGPKPSTFSGERALNFVLDNPRVDRTLLFNVKLIRVDKADGRGGFTRGDRV
eukprot:CAMPEP_0197182154 /NCGR_PEP_ID=MMETSP1423-20130617/6207_1 /TAXON_ID=476441 /ORGANISM="Pseudo-nitzschia heimii, Strain UNC1101" /LENGTH=264 /DNA_ID=CAMNT_0042632531 /DNA_START=143 /DNA_END=937 /DNA_ORIENTATION=+